MRPSIKVQIGADIRIPISGNEPVRRIDLLKALRRALTKDDPRYLKARQSGRRPAKGVKPHLRLYQENKKFIVVPSGMHRTVKRIAGENGLDIQWLNATKENKGKAMEISDMPVTLRDYQKDAIAKCFAYKRGIFEAACGAGKTTTGTAFALNSGQATIVLTHSTDLLEQWKSCFEWVSGGKASVRIISGSTKKDLSKLKPGEICLATIQTLSRDPAKYKNILLSAGCVLIDECHHASSSTWQSVINRIPARYRIGFTATPSRADDLSFVVRATIGEIFFQITSLDLVKQGYLRRPVVIPVKTRFSPDHRHKYYDVKCSKCGRTRKQMTWSKLEEGLSRCRCGSRLTLAASRKEGRINFSALETDTMLDPRRMDEITDLTIRAVQAGRKCLVLISRNEAVEKVVSKLTLMGIKAFALTGKTKKKDRERILNAMRFGSGQVMVSAKIADEGLDVANLDFLLLASAGKFNGLAKQRIGRLSRPSGAETPLLMDLVDDGGVFRRQHKQRKEAFVEAYGQCVRQAVSMEQARSILNKMRDS